MKLIALFLHQEECGKKLIALFLLHEKGLQFLHQGKMSDN